MIFNKDEVFDRNLDCLQDDYLYINLEELSQLLTSIDVTAKPKEIKTEDSGPIRPPESDFLNECIFVRNSRDLDEDIQELED